MSLFVANGSAFAIIQFRYGLANCLLQLVVVAVSHRQEVFGGDTNPSFVALTNICYSLFVSLH